MASASKVIPFVGPAQTSAHVEIIGQAELALVLSLRGRLSQLSQQVETAEESLKRRLEQGAGVESGDHTATLKITFRRNVAWKDVASRLAARLKLDGAAYTARVLAATRPTETVSLQLR